MTASRLTWARVGDRYPDLAGTPDDFLALDGDDGGRCREAHPGRASGFGRVDVVHVPHVARPDLQDADERDVQDPGRGGTRTRRMLAGVPRVVRDRGLGAAALVTARAAVERELGALHEPRAVTRASGREPFATRSVIPLADQS